MAGAIKRKTEHGGARHSQDKFYTKPNIAETLTQSILPILYHSEIIVEPSAGSGAFLQLLNTHQLPYKAYDIEPEHPNVEKGNWFNITRNHIGNGTLTVIGNPPFGIRGDLAKRFIKHAIKLNAETIAFILPQTFSKLSNQTETLYPKEYRLIIEQPIPKESFTLEGETFHIPCSWFVWTKNATYGEGANLRKQKQPPHPDFTFLPRGDTSADFTVNGNNGRVKSLDEVTNPKAEHYIRVQDRERVDEVKAKFLSLNYVLVSSVNGGVAWAGQQEILAAYRS